jgi:cysteine sulfinate desulfinase/cysteine desulfurase-like protein
MKVPADWLQGAVRFSLGRFNTREEILYVNEKMPAIVQRLEGLSALGRLREGTSATVGGKLAARG